MKKISLMLLMSVFVAMPAFANIHINPDVVVLTVTDTVPPEYYNATLKEYNAQLKASNGEGIAANKLWNVCAAAGWAINTPSGKSKCEDFVSALVKNAKVKYFEVCTDKGKTAAQQQGAQAYCIDDFFTNKFYGGTQVGISEGIQLAKEYARIKHNDASLQCSSILTKRLGGLDDGLRCASKNKNAYYEFVFDDLDESVDKTHHDDVQKAICKMYDAAATTSGCSAIEEPDGTGSHDFCWPATCETDAVKCEKINKSLEKFGYSAKYAVNNFKMPAKTECIIDFNEVLDSSELKTAFGIDNFVFCSDSQIKNDESAERIIKQYIVKKAGVQMSDIRCDAGFRIYKGSGCNVNGITDFKDNIKTCYIKNQQIDFVIDDINETSETYRKGGLQAMQCIVSGGTYSGKRCLNIQDEQSCRILRDANIKNCPECKKIYWDKNSRTCVLPDAESATNLKKNIEIGIIVGGTLISAALTLGGSLIVEGGLSVGVIGIVTLETVGGTIEAVTTLELQGVADKFLVKSNNCHNQVCAERLIGENLQYLANIQDDMSSIEIGAIDKEIARLAKIIPANSDFYKRMLKRGLTLKDNEVPFWQSWESEQIWRAVGIALNMAGIISGLTKFLVHGSTAAKSALNTTELVLSRRIQEAVQYLDPTQQKFYEAWIQYAPRSQSLDDFIKMFDGDMAKLAESSTEWKTLAQRQEIARAKNSVQDQAQSLAKKILGENPATPRQRTMYGDDADKFVIAELKMDLMYADASKRQEILQKYATHSDDLNEFFRLRDLSDMPVDNYSTYDPALTKFIKEAGDDPEFAELRNALEQRRINAEKNLSPEEYTEYLNTQHKQGLENLDNMYKAKYNNLTAQNVSLNSLSEVVAERRILFEEIVKSDPELLQMSNDWENLTKEQRLQFGQRVLDKHSDYNMTSRVTLRDYSDPSFDPDMLTFGGYYNNMGDVYMPVEKYNYYDSFLNTLSHEAGHSVDNLNPEMGALGAQKYGWASNIYSNKNEFGYRQSLLEQSSYAIGDAVERSASVANVADDVAEQSSILVNTNVSTGDAIGIATGAVTGQLYVTEQYIAPTVEKTKEIVPEVVEKHAIPVIQKGIIKTIQQLDDNTEQ